MENENEIYEYSETGEVEQLHTDLLDDGRVMFTVNEATAVRYEPDITVMTVKDTDNGEVSWIVQFRLLDTKEEES